ncbi:uncharacterized protein LOC144438053 [Glandiceps talaboti]
MLTTVIVVSEEADVGHPSFTGAFPPLRYLPPWVQPEDETEDRNEGPKTGAPPNVDDRIFSTLSKQGEVQPTTVINSTGFTIDEKITKGERIDQKPNKDYATEAVQSSKETNGHTNKHVEDSYYVVYSCGSGTTISSSSRLHVVLMATATFAATIAMKKL